MRTITLIGALLFSGGLLFGEIGVGAFGLVLLIISLFTGGKKEQ